MYLNNTIKKLKTQDEIVLHDISDSGRERPWREKKLNNTLLALIYDNIDKKKADRLRDCASWLDYTVDSNGRKRLKKANFCRVRLCPICTWRRSLKIYSQMNAIINAINKDKRDYVYLFITLTMRNMVGNELNDGISEILEAYNRFSRYKDIASVVKGSYRSLEITHNVDYDSPNFDTYHPHLHCIFAVNKSYFNDSKQYLSHAKWVALWRKALRCDYDPVVYVKKTFDSTMKSISELAKYSVKDKDYIMPQDWEFSIESVQVLDKALNNRRLVSFGGVFKDYHHQLQLDDAEAGDLLNVDNDDKINDDRDNTITYNWSSSYMQYRSKD